jgi:hypothetical protein
VLQLLNGQNLLGFARAIGPSAIDREKQSLGANLFDGGKDFCRGIRAVERQH